MRACYESLMMEARSPLAHRWKDVEPHRVDLSGLEVLCKSCRWEDVEDCLVCSTCYRQSILVRKSREKFGL